MSEMRLVVAGAVHYAIRMPPGRVDLEETIGSQPKPPFG